MACEHRWIEHFSFNTPEPWKPDMRFCPDCQKRETLQEEIKPMETKGDGVSTWVTKVATSAGKFFGWRNRIYGRNNEHDTVYMTRFWIGRLRLHVFWRGDKDPDHHDHPWGFWTFPLNSYVEEVVETRSPLYDESGNCIEWAPDGAVREVYRQVVPAWRLHYRPATHTHRVLGRYVPGRTEFDTAGETPVPSYDSHGKVTTIVWRGKDERKWGFLKNRDGKWCWVHWKDYVFGGGKDAACK